MSTFNISILLHESLHTSAYVTEAQEQNKRILDLSLSICSGRRQWVPSEKSLYISFFHLRALIHRSSKQEKVMTAGVTFAIKQSSYLY